MDGIFSEMNKYTHIYRLGVSAYSDFQGQILNGLGAPKLAPVLQ